MHVCMHRHMHARIGICMHTQVCNDLAELRAEDTQLLYQGLHTFHAHLDKTVAALRLEWREAKLARQECDLTWTMAGGGGGGTLGASVRMPSDTQHGLTLGHALGLQGGDCALEGSPSRLESARLEALAQKVEAVAAEVGGVREEGSARVSAVESALRQLRLDVRATFQEQFEQNRVVNGAVTALCRRQRGGGGGGGGGAGRVHEQDSVGMVAGERPVPVRSMRGREGQGQRQLCIGFDGYGSFGLCDCD